MNRIILISCAKKKLPHAAAAELLYTSHLFKLSLAYARQLKPDAIYILSAEHGLVPLDQQLAPYDRTLLKMTRAERAAWGRKLINQLASASITPSDHFIILAGRAYYDLLIPALPHHSLPLAGLGQGQRIRFLTRALAATPQVSNAALPPVTTTLPLMQNSRAAQRSK